MLLVLNTALSLTTLVVLLWGVGLYIRAWRKIRKLISLLYTKMDDLLEGLLAEENTAAVAQPQQRNSRSLKRRRQNARGWPLSQPGGGPDSTWGRPGPWKKSTYWATTRLESSTPSTRHDWGLPLQKLWDARLCNCTQMWSVCFYRFLPRTGSRSWLNSSPTRSSTTRSPA